MDRSPRSGGRTTWRAAWLSATLVLSSLYWAAGPVAAAPTITGGTDVLAGEDALSEVSIDVNPTNPQNLVIAGHEPTFENLATFFSTDGGATWTAVDVGDAGDGLVSDFRFDPSVAFDEDGNVYVAYGARIDDSPRHDIVVVARSTNGGASYTTFAQLADTNRIGNLPGNDKWHLATGPDPGDPGEPPVYMSWTQNVSESSGTDQRIVVSGSTNGGTTWSAPVIINDASVSGTKASNLGADPAVGPDGRVWVTWSDLDNGDVVLDSSADGATWGTDLVVTNSSAGFKTPILPQPSRGVGAMVMLDTDRSGRAHDGRLYLAFTDDDDADANDAIADADDTDLNTYVTWSDNGTTWSAPARVNDDATDREQFLPWLDVDQETGLVTTVWYDTRDDANEQLVHVYASVSEDGGATWGANVRVTDAASNASTSAPATRYQGEYLEYIGVATHDCRIVPVWADARNTSTFDFDFYVDRLTVTGSPLCNQPPTADAGGPYSVNEGSAVTLDGSGSTDPDGDALTYEWDVNNDGTFDTSGSSATQSYTFAQDGSYTVTLRVTDPDGASDTDTATVVVANVAPTVTIATITAIDEHGTATVSGTISDPGWLDPLTATIDFEDGAGAVALAGTLENNAPDATLSFTVTHQYGDNGVFTVTVVGHDDDTSTSASSTAAVDNVDPTAVIDTTGEQVYDGKSAFVVEAGETLTIPAGSEDPGSDDLAFLWGWGDGNTSAETSLVNPPAADPAKSPTVQPRDVDLSASHAYGDACLYQLTLGVSDDDGGSASDSAAVLITGNATVSKGHGWWLNQYRAKSGNDFTLAQLECYLDIVGYLSLVFDESTDASTRARATRILNAPAKSPERVIFDQHALGAWLNFANGSVKLGTPVDTDANGTLDSTFGAAMLTAEQIRMNPASTSAQVKFQKDIIARIALQSGG